MHKASFRAAIQVQETIDSLANGIIHFDEKGNLLAFNPVAINLIPKLDKNESDAIRDYKKFLAYIYDHSIDLQSQKKFSLDLAQQEDGTKLMFQEIIKDARERVIIVQFYPHKIRGIIAILTDITLLKRHADTASLLEDENKVMIEAIESLSKGLFIGQADNDKISMLFANKAFCKMMHVPASNISQKYLSQIISSSFEDVDSGEIIASILIKTKHGQTENIWLKTSDMNKLPAWYMLQVFPVTDKAGKRLVVGFLSDQTQARLHEAQLYQTQKLEAIGQLAGGIAHDFNNIFSIIDGYAKLAENGQKRKEDIGVPLQHIRKAIKRGSLVTGRLLAFGNQPQAQTGIVNATEHLRDLESFLVPLLDGVPLILSLEDTPVYIACAADAVTQIVMHLAFNARDAAPAGGNIIVSLTEADPLQIASLAADLKGRFARLQVIDNGPGIPAEILPKIFNPFFTTKEAGKGTGMGLSLVYGLVRQAGGIIDVKSSRHTGATISVFLPICEPREDEFFSEKKEIETTNILTDKVALIAEDEPELLQLMQIFLEDLGLKVLTAGNGDEALAVQDDFSGHIDFLVTDVVMPGMSGLKLAELMKEVRPATKTIFMSGYPTRGDHAPVSLPEDSILLQKPIDEKDLEKLLMQYAQAA